MPRQIITLEISYGAGYDPAEDSDPADPETWAWPADREPPAQWPFEVILDEFYDEDSDPQRLYYTKQVHVIQVSPVYPLPGEDGLGTD